VMTVLQTGALPLGYVAILFPCGKPFVL